MDNVGKGIGVVALVAGLLAIINWVSMLVLGAAAGYEGWHTPGYWETFFGLWAIAIIGGAFNGINKVKS